MDGARGAAVLLQQVDRRAFPHDHADPIGLRGLEILLGIAEYGEDVVRRTGQQVEDFLPPGHRATVPLSFSSGG